MSTSIASGNLISGDEALAAFRQRLRGSDLLGELDQAGGQLLVELAVGVGKSRSLNDLTRAALAADRYDLILILAPRKDILFEIRKAFVKGTKLPKKVKPLILKPRPSPLCGDLDPDWVKLERAGCSRLARETLCKGCPNRAKCTWLGQYGKKLRHARLILATQQHLQNNPDFVAHIQAATGASRTLVLLDESDLLLKRVERVVRLDQLKRFIRAQEMAFPNAGTDGSEAGKWLELCKLLSRVKTCDLKGPDWRFPFINPEWAGAVQAAGRNQFGEQFTFLGDHLVQFASSDSTSRERLANGSIRFAALPSLGREFVIFSGSMARELARYRLDPNHARRPIQSPFAGIRFEHPETRWYNLRMSDGSAKYFPGNADVILDFFAALVARNLKDGKKTLLVAKKEHAEQCARCMRERLNKLLPNAKKPIRVVTGNWAKNLKDPWAIPLITYGISGVNRFEDCDAAYCLTGFYVPESVIEETVFEIEPTPDRFPLRVITDGTPPGRRVEVNAPDGRETIIPSIANGVLAQKEADVIVQAVGRVRPFTKAREVITFHLGELPGVQFTSEFRTLETARKFFGVTTPTRAARLEKKAQAIELRASGLTLTKIAVRLGISLATVKRHLKP